MNTMPKADRPLIVSVVTVYVAVHLATVVLNQFAVTRWSEFQFQVKFTILVLGAIILPIWLWRGLSWVRWVVLGVLVVGFLANFYELVERRADYSALAIVVRLLRSVPDFVLVLCLFHPIPSAWFRRGARAT